MKEIIVLFKTHLDIGYTDFAEAVVDKYMNEYIPNALRVAKAMRGRDERFIWSMGAWMIDRYLQTGADKEAMLDAIAHGDIRWHALPFTTHTELMTAALFEQGIGISKKLDRQFGKTTIAAKMTDVPGHTCAAIAPMVNSGIQFLHIGVNPASAVPKVPQLFHWQAPTGESILVMYNNEYGTLTQIGNTDTMAYFAYTNDNLGPQSVAEVEQVYQNLHSQYPDATLRAGTLEDVAAAALQATSLPVVAEEIGDTWIHGAASDPGKISMYRALLRFGSTLCAEDRHALYNELLLVPEHTWGLCEERFLGTVDKDGNMVGEHKYFVRKEFEEVRGTEKFQKMERSWQEQRNYLLRAVNALPSALQEKAHAAMRGYKRPPTATEGFVPVRATEDVQVNGFTVGVNAQGALCRLEKDGQVLADAAHCLAAFVYEAFSQHELDAFADSYITKKADWALEDFGKIGCEKAIQQKLTAYPTLTSVSIRGNQLLLAMEMQGDCVALYGAPATLETLITFSEDCVAFDTAWFHKSASRVPEGLWMRFHPTAPLTQIHKMGQWIDPCTVVDNGNKRMHGVDYGVKFEGLSLQTVDCAVVNIGAPALYHFSNDAVSTVDGVCFSLYNNAWGTNFPMWYEEDARFRFVLHLG
ncbi:MAG: DUF5054 domain-containing protein [Gemmiger sp.]|nr:DUF5054 domain-containing protein [Gemmiger sp.]